MCFPFLLFFTFFFFFYTLLHTIHVTFSFIADSHVCHFTALNQKKKEKKKVPEGLTDSQLKSSNLAKSGLGPISGLGKIHEKTHHGG